MIVDRDAASDFVTSNDRLLNQFLTSAVIQTSSAQCENVLSIDTMDNPGWSVYVYLERTKFNQKTCLRVTSRRSNVNWLRYKVDKNILECFCGARNLSELLTFVVALVEDQRNWFDKGTSKKSDKQMAKGYALDPATSHLDWLQLWYHSQCDGDWEHQYGVTMTLKKSEEWEFDIDLTYTEMQGIHLSDAEQSDPEGGWLRWRSDGWHFRAECSRKNVIAVIAEFRTWVESSGWKLPG